MTSTVENGQKANLNYTTRQNCNIIQTSRRKDYKRIKVALENYVNKSEEHLDIPQPIRRSRWTKGSRYLKKTRRMITANAIYASKNKNLCLSILCIA